MLQIIFVKFISNGNTGHQSCKTNIFFGNNSPAIKVLKHPGFSEVPT